MSAPDLLPRTIGGYWPTGEFPCAPEDVALALLYLIVEQDDLPHREPDGTFRIWAKLLLTVQDHRVNWPRS